MDTQKKQGRLVLPEGTQVLRHPGGSEWLKARPRLAIWLWRVDRFLARLAKSVFAPFVDPGALFQFITVPFFIFLARYLLGVAGMIDELNIIATTVLSVVLALPVWFVLNFLGTAIFSRKFESDIGTWSGNKFILHSPQHVFTCEWKPDNNGEFRDIKVRGVPAYALVDYQVLVDGPAERVNVIVIGSDYLWPIDGLLKHCYFRPRGRARLRRGNILRLYARSLPNTVESVFRVQINAWEMNPDISFEYEDQNSGTRMVVTNPEKRSECVTEQGINSTNS